MVACKLSVFLLSRHYSPALCAASTAQPYRPEAHGGNGETVGADGSGTDGRGHDVSGGFADLDFPVASRTGGGECAVSQRSLVHLYSLPWPGSQWRSAEYGSAAGRAQLQDNGD